MDREHSDKPSRGGSESGRARLRQAGVVRLATVVGALGVVVVTASACSGGSPLGVANVGTTATTGPSNGQSSSQDPSSNSSTGGSQSGLALVGGNATQSLALAQCMRAHGVADFPDPNAQGQIQMSGEATSDLNPNNPTFQKAMSACQSKMPKPSPAQQAQALQNALKMARCMRAHGITDFPDPQSGPGGRISMSLNGSPSSDLNPNDPAFQAAQKVCMPNALLPTKGGTGSGNKSGSGAVFSTGGAG